jgi:predicted AlkP superfamily phosphohydrolase/phosphomutase
MSRVLVVGIDGGTFDIIQPLINKGKLPNIKSLMETGCHGYLETTMPPMTFPAWTSFMTGVNPGKHGVFDFTERIPGTYMIRFINARARMAKTIWQIASEANKRVGVLAVPVTYPPEKVNGFMVCGFDAPGVGALADANSVHPPELLDEIKQNVGDYIISSNIIKEIDSGRADIAIDIALKTLGKKAETAKYLYKKEAWDLFMVLFGESDLVGHHYWKYIDPKSPFYDSGADEKCAKAVEMVYEKIDRTIGELKGIAPRDTVIMLMSDHGFGGSGDSIIYLNRWLEKEAFLKFKSQSNRLLERLFIRPLMFAKRYGIKYLPPKIKQNIFRKRTSVANNMESWLRFSKIDWGQTLAYSEETPYYPTIWLNLEGREPDGIVPVHERDGVLERITDALCRWKDPYTGENVVRKVYRREEIYSGPYVDKAPDLIIDYHEPGGFSYLSKASYTDSGKDVIRKLTRKELDSARFQNKNGSHRKLGIFTTCGDCIKTGTEVSGVRILDFAPTILHLLGLPVPQEMDGRIIDGCLREDYQKPHTQREESRGERLPAGSPIEHEETYSPEEEDVIKKRLRDLGYIE